MNNTRGSRILQKYNVNSEDDKLYFLANRSNMIATVFGTILAILFLFQFARYFPSVAVLNRLEGGNAYDLIIKTFEMSKLIFISKLITSWYSIFVMLIIFMTSFISFLSRVLLIFKADKDGDLIDYDYYNEMSILNLLFATLSLLPLFIFQFIVYSFDCHLFDDKYKKVTASDNKEIEVIEKENYKLQENLMVDIFENNKKKLSNRMINHKSNY